MSVYQIQRLCQISEELLEIRDSLNVGVMGNSTEECQDHVNEAWEHVLSSIHHMAASLPGAPGRTNNSFYDTDDSSDVKD